MGPKGQNIQVVVRCRPLNSSERSKGCSAVECTSDRVVVRERITPTAASKTFTFDRVFGPNSKQVELYRAVVKPAVEEVLEGYNCTVFAYGQTGTGKTFTMIGERGDELKYSWENDPLAGVIPRSLSHLFDRLEANAGEFSVRVSFLELYNEELFDLLTAGTDTARLRIFDDANRKGSVVVQGLEEISVSNKDAVYEIIQRGMQRRATASTLLNAQSSRSHSVFTVTVHMRENSVDGEELVKIGKLNLVDLAGSENIGRSGALEKRAREAGSINQSLLTLGRVITALVERTPHVPYRESKLTRILQDSLGGRTKTSIIATVTPSSTSLEETLSTLDYAHRAKNIQNRPEVNQRLCKKALLKEYSDEVERLRRDLQATRDKTGIFMDQANYQQMQTTLQQQRERIIEQDASCAAQRLENERLTDQLTSTEETVSQLEETARLRDEELGCTRRRLESCRQRLLSAEVGRREECALKEAHSAAEGGLASDAETLVLSVKEAVGHVQGLHAKVGRMQEHVAKNAGHGERLVEDVEGRCDALCMSMEQNKVDQQAGKKNLKDDLDALRTCYSDRVGAMRQIADQHAALWSQSTAEVAEQVRQQAAATEQLLGGVSGMVETVRQDGSRRMEDVGLEMTSLLRDTVGQTGEKFLAQVTAMKKGVDEEEKKVVAAVQKERCEQQTMLSQLSDMLSTMSKQHESDRAALRQQMQQQDANLQHLKQQLAAVLSKLDHSLSHQEQLRQSLDASDNSHVQQLAAAGAALARLSTSADQGHTRLDSHAHGAADAARTALANAEAIGSDHRAAVNTLAEQLGGRCGEAACRLDDDCGKVEKAVKAASVDVRTGGERLATAADCEMGRQGEAMVAGVKQWSQDEEHGNRAEQMAEQLEIMRRTAVEEYEKRKEEVVAIGAEVKRTVEVEMVERPATGQTPAKKEWKDHLHVKLRRASPDAILERCRAELDVASLEAACRADDEQPDAKRRRLSVAAESECQPENVSDATSEAVVGKSTSKATKRPLQNQNC